MVLSHQEGKRIPGYFRDLTSQLTDIILLNFLNYYIFQLLTEHLQFIY